MNNDNGRLVLETDDVEILERREAEIQGIPLFVAHWQIFAPTLLICVLYLVVWGLLLSLGEAGQGNGRVFIIAMAMITPILAAWAFLKYQTIRLQISDNHLYVHLGWPREMPVDIPLTAVDSLSVRRGVVGRMFGGGSLHITLTDGRIVKVRDLSHPEEAERAISDVL